MLKFHLIFLQGLQDFCAQQHPQSAIIFTAIGNGIVMRPKDNRAIAAFFGLLAPEVGNPIRLDRQSQLMLPASCQPGPGLLIRNTPQLAVNALGSIFAYLAKLVKPRHQPLPVYLYSLCHAFITFPPVTAYSARNPGCAAAVDGQRSLPASRTPPHFRLP